MTKLRIRRVPKQGQAYTQQEIDETVGLGDLIAKATGHMGIQPCTPCKKRAAWLNQRIRIRRGQ